MFIVLGFVEQLSLLFIDEGLSKAVFFCLQLSDLVFFAYSELVQFFMLVNFGFHFIFCKPTTSSSLLREQNDRLQDVARD